ncbi:hypothetical protein ERX37_08960 [Macrococcus hajekii]|uniref:Uncharacterized protein n=1 Tax=Macrococcus hajekii TaxID=198482 RepID=A0A4R6BIW6_9STAP|nr:hypothetical protein [Macrococcus hajekii]TDM01613.1 hypothetical protein ERX37_08960 [Macrococcus hajekii]GGB01505.1 hypothetical protein GCM10007190_06960 [Macrococcus hajekii]
MQKQTGYALYLAPFIMTFFSYHTYANSIMKHPDAWRIILSGLGFTFFFCAWFYMIWVKEAWGQ